MKKIILVLGLLLSTQGAMAFTDSAGLQCETKVARLTKVYFNVVDTYEKLNYAVSKKDQIEVNSFASVTPGTYNQEYVAEMTVKFDRSNKWAPEKDQKIRVKFTGEFDCDNLKIKNLKSMGGVERVD